MFFGTFHHRINVKSQLTVPSRFRQLIGEHGKLYIAKIKNGRLFVYTQAEMDKVYADLRAQLLRSNPDALDSMTGRFTPVDMDGQGRIVIPAHLKDAVGIEEDVVVVGNGRRITLWPRERWEKSEAEVAAVLQLQVEENMDVFL